MSNSVLGIVFLGLMTLILSGNSWANSVIDIPVDPAETITKVDASTVKVTSTVNEQIPLQRLYDMRQNIQDNINSGQTTWDAQLSQYQSDLAELNKRITIGEGK